MRPEHAHQLGVAEGQVEAYTHVLFVLDALRIDESHKSVQEIKKSLKDAVTRKRAISKRLNVS